MHVLVSVSAMIWLDNRIGNLRKLEIKKDLPKMAVVLLTANF